MMKVLEALKDLKVDQIDYRYCMLKDIAEVRLSAPYVQKLRHVKKFLEWNEENKK